MTPRRLSMHKAVPSAWPALLVSLLLGACGSGGGSSGGGFQMLLWAIDPDRRLDAIVPEITWNDLDFSLNPGEVVKSVWALTLAAAGDANTGFGQDSVIRATLIEGAAAGRFPEEMRDFFTYHSPAYFCGDSRDIPLGSGADSSGFLLDSILQLLPITADGEFFVNTPPIAGAPPRVDALIFQGQRDDLFNLNEAFANFRCLQRGGGDVRLLTPLVTVSGRVQVPLVHAPPAGG